MSTALLSKVSIRLVNGFCSEDNSIWLSFPLASCDPFKKTTPELINFSNRLSFLPLSLVCSFGYVLHCSGAFVPRSCIPKYSFELHTTSSRLVLARMRWCPLPSSLKLSVEKANIRTILNLPKGTFWPKADYFPLLLLAGMFLE